MTPTGQRFRRVMIANRGEIALRIVRACRELGLESVVAYSEADREMPYVRGADASIRIGPAPARASYLDADVLVSAARATRCEAIHPGYGFLSENAAFARKCADAGLVFVGPPAQAIETMGDKIAAKEFARAAGVPLVEGGTLEAGADGPAIAAGLPFPVLLKAAAGGGGRGMRLVRAAADFAASLQQARAEAREAFGDETVYWERYIGNARHVEVQVLSDRHGNHLHLWERDCSLQRRHQKLLEESPSPAIDAQTRERLCATSVDLARSLNYEGAGTMEFLYDQDRGSIHFIEMNTRIQVEHPVTEAVTGVDLVREQLRIAAGAAIGTEALAARPRGHAIECRINAEDPAVGFLPCPGRLERFAPPGGPGVRVDTHCRAGTEISPFYDSMIAKLIVWDHDRELARRRMLRALAEFEVEGIATTIPFHMDMLESREFIESRYDTGWIERRNAEACA